MKKLNLVAYLLFSLVTIDCRHHQGNLNLTYEDSERYYTMEADYSETRTRAVEEYMDDRIGSPSNMSFVNTKIDGQLALDDHTTFYIKKNPGFLRIKLDKDKNSRESYEKIRSMCEGLKKIIAK